jgi:hypothetical protein
MPSAVRSRTNRSASAHASAMGIPRAAPSPLLMPISRTCPVKTSPRIARRRIPLKRLAPLLCGPPRRQVAGHAEMEHPPPVVGQRRECVQDLEPNRGNGKEVTRRHALQGIIEERSPDPRRRLPARRTATSKPNSAACPGGGARSARSRPWPTPWSHAQKPRAGVPLSGGGILRPAGRPIHRLPVGGSSGETWLQGRPRPESRVNAGGIFERESASWRAAATRQDSAGWRRRGIRSGPSAQHGVAAQVPHLDARIPRGASPPKPAGELRYDRIPDPPAP